MFSSLKFALVIAAALSASRVAAEDMLFMYDGIYGVVQEETRHCQTPADLRFDLTVEMRTMSLAHDVDYLRGIIRTAIQKARSWSGRDLCRVNFDKVPITADIMFQGDRVALFTAISEEYNWVIEPMLKDVVEKSDSTFGEALTDALTQGNIGWDQHFDARYSYDAAINSLITIIPQTRGEETAIVLHTIGLATEIKNYGNPTPESNAVVYAYYEEAARLGNLEATERQYRYSGLEQAINKVQYDMQSSSGNVLTDEARESFESYGYIFDLAIAGNSGAIVAERDQLNEGGYQIGASIFSIDESLPPGEDAVEAAVNARLRDGIARTDAAITAFFNDAHDTEMTPGTALRCDDIWCYDLTGTTRMRFSVRAKPVCDPVVDMSTKCTFPLRFVVSAQFGTEMPYSGDGVVELLNEIMRGAREVAGDKMVEALFSREKERWHISRMEVLE